MPPNIYDIFWGITVRTLTAFLVAINCLKIQGPLLFDQALHLLKAPFEEELAANRTFLTEEEFLSDDYLAVLENVSVVGLASPAPPLFGPNLPVSIPRFPANDSDQALDPSGTSLISAILDHASKTLSSLSWPAIALPKINSGSAVLSILLFGIVVTLTFYRLQDMWHTYNLEEEIALWKAKFSTLRKCKEDGEAVASDTLRTLNTLQNEKGDLEVQLCKLRGRHEEELHCTKLEQERQQDDLRVELRARQKPNEKLQIEIESIRGQFNGLQRKHAEMLDSFSAENLDHEATKGQLESRTKELVKVKEKKNAGALAIRKMTNELRDAKTELVNVKIELGQTHARSSVLESDLRGKAIELSVAKNDLYRMGSQLCQAKTYLQEKDSEISEARTALKENGHQISKSKVDLEEKASQLSQAKNELMEKANLLSEAEAELKDKDGQLQEAKIELEENASQLSQARTHLKERDNQISETKTELENKASQLSRAETELEEKASEISRPNTEFESKAIQLSEVTAEPTKIEPVQNAAEIEISHVKEVTSTKSKIEKAKVDNKPETDNEFRLNGEKNISPASGAAEEANSADESTPKDETETQLGEDEVESDMSQLERGSSVSSPPSEAKSHPADRPIRRRSFRFRTAGELATSSHNVRRKYRLELKAHEKEVERTKSESAPSSKSAFEDEDAGLNASAGWFHPGIVPVPGKVIEGSGGLVKPKEPKPVCKYGPRRTNSGRQQTTTQGRRPNQVPHGPQQRAFHPRNGGFRPGNNFQQNNGYPTTNGVGNYAAHAELFRNSNNCPARNNFPAGDRFQQSGGYLDSAWAPNNQDQQNGWEGGNYGGYGRFQG